MQDRGLAAYIAELVGTLLLVFFITSVVVALRGHRPERPVRIRLRSRRPDALPRAVRADHQHRRGERRPLQPCGHHRPSSSIRRIDPIDGLVYILAQLSGGVLGALLTKAFLLDEGRASDYGTPKVSALLGGAFQGVLVEGIGAFVLC